MNTYTYIILVNKKQVNVFSQMLNAFKNDCVKRTYDIVTIDEMRHDANEKFCAFKVSCSTLHTIFSIGGLCGANRIIVSGEVK